jgi:hypothetical protein
MLRQTTFCAITSVISDRVDRQGFRLSVWQIGTFIASPQARP